MSINYNQFTKKQIIIRIIRTEPQLKSNSMLLNKYSKKNLIKILKNILKEKEGNEQNV